jgi:hypothetical protein
MSNRGFSITKCPTCDSPTIRKVSGTWTGVYEGKTYTVKALEYYTCPNCHEKVYPLEAMRQIQRASPAYRAAGARRARAASKPRHQANT